MPQQLEHTHACGRVAMSTMGGGPLAPRRPVNADKQAGSSAFAGSMRSGSSGYLRDPARAPNGLLARRGRDRAPKQDCRAVALTFPCHAVEAGRANQFSKSPERRTLSFARLLAVGAAARASPGEREGTGAYSGQPRGQDFFQPASGIGPGPEIALQPAGNAGRPDRPSKCRHYLRFAVTRINSHLRTTGYGKSVYLPKPSHLRP